VTQFGAVDKVTILIKKKGTDEYVEIAKSAAKKLQKKLDGMRQKEAKAALTAAAGVVAKETDEAEVQIVEDPSLAEAEKIKIRQAGEKRGGRVVVYGWVSTVRVQSRKLVFLDLRDGSDLTLQCVLNGKLVRVHNTSLIPGEESRNPRTHSRNHNRHLGFHLACPPPSPVSPDK
jgi:Asparaginal-tRNA synthetase, N-terminal domain/OB-fold nucleic acid binding domain